MVGTQRLQRDLLLQELRSHEGVKEEANIGNQQSERDQISAENVFLKGEIERLQQ
jgi:cell division protein FtsB